jgi:hypothetical protein
MRGPHPEEPPKAASRRMASNTGPSFETPFLTKRLLRMRAVAWDED